MAKHLEISIRNFSELEAQAVIVPVERGRGGRASVYDVVETLKRYIRFLRQERPAGGERSARERRDRAQAELTEQLVRARSGQVISLAEAERAMSLVVQAARATLLRLPVSLAAQVAGETDPAQVECLLRASLYAALTELSNWRAPASTPLPAPTPIGAARRRKKERTT